MICILCGLDASTRRQMPIAIARLEFRPFINQNVRVENGVLISEAGQDSIVGAVCCQDCYAKVLANRAKAIAESGKIKTPEE
jgi:hypothetical protein